MNKIIVFITCSMLCFSAFSCGDIEKENEKTTQKVSGEMLDSGIIRELQVRQKQLLANHIYRVLRLDHILVIIMIDIPMPTQQLR